MKVLMPRKNRKRVGADGRAARKPKVALVYDLIYPYVKGGGERRFYEFGIRLVASGYEVHWYGMKYWEGPNTIEHNGIILHGLCKVRPIYTKSGRRSISQALIFGLSSFKLLFVDFDVIDCCGFPYFSLFPAKLAAIIKRKPLFATWHEVWGKKYWREYLGPAGIIGFRVEQLAAKLPNHIIATSQHTADLLQKELGINSSTVVVNGVDMDAIAALKPAKRHTDVIYVGRLMDFKNIHLIIEALAGQKSNGTILSCTIIGKGPAKAKLQRLATKLGVADQITWLGILEKSDDVYAHMKAAKVLVLPSKREGFGMVVIEANASATPVLTANFAGNAAKDLIQDGMNGYVFEPTRDGLSAALEKTLKELKKLERSTPNFVKAYDWGNLSHKLIEVYGV
jgi:glycosyltransferase involved in cell wall biosynthesis